MNGDGRYAPSRLQALGCLASVVLLASPAQAALLTFEAVGTVTSIADPDGVAPFPVSVGDAISVRYVFESGVPVAGTSPFGGTVYQDAILSVRVDVGGNSAAWAAGMESQYLAIENRIVVHDDRLLNPAPTYFDHYGIVSGGFYSPDSYSTVILSLNSNTAAPPVQPFTSEALPTTPPSIADFPTTSSGGGARGSYAFRGTPDLGGALSFGQLAFTIEQLNEVALLPIALFFDPLYPPPVHEDWDNLVPKYPDVLFATPVPVPATVWLMGSALAGLFGLRLRSAA